MKSQQQRGGGAALLHKPVRTGRTRHDRALDTLGLAIVRGQYSPGSLLPSKEELMSQIKISQTTLREALQTLAAKGMISPRARVGTRVRDEKHWNMFDAELLAWRFQVGIPPALLGMLMEIRQSLEPLAAALAAVRRSAEDLRNLRVLTARMQSELRHSREFVEADVAFHSLVLEASGNTFMYSLAALISTALSASFVLSAPDHDPELAARVYRQHEDIVDAIEAADPSRASLAMTTVITQGWLNVGGAIPECCGQLDLLRFSIQEVSRDKDARRPRKAAIGRIRVRQ